MSILNIRNLLDKCCGCEACSNVCPVSAIEMEADSAGFFYPKINEQCVQCGKCYLHCPLNQNNEKTFKHLYYESYAKDQALREKGSSGGLFSVFSNYVLENGGVVVGALLTEDLLVKHAIIGGCDELPFLYGSKYVQSRIFDTYRSVLDNLKKGRKVLFSGTPCQVAGLKSFLNKEYDNLITIDFVCHGVPSATFFSEMIAFYEKKYKGTIVKTTFREKVKGWRKQSIRFYFSDGRVISVESIKTLYYVAFLHNLSLRNSCYSCRYSTTHIADITLADFWKTEKTDDKGCSLVVLNSDKGVSCFQQIKEKVVYNELDFLQVEYALQPREPVSYGYHKKEEFITYLQQYGYRRTQRKYLPRPSILNKIKGIVKKILKRIGKIVGNESK